MRFSQYAPLRHNYIYIAIIIRICIDYRHIVNEVYPIYIKQYLLSVILYFITYNHKFLTGLNKT